MTTTTTTPALRRAHLAAIVAIWLTNGQQPVDGANEPRVFVDNDWDGAHILTCELVDVGLLKRDDSLGGRRRVTPTAAGLFSVLVNPALGVGP